MNDFSELEKQLRNLRPILPSENLTLRIERALAETKSTNGAAVLLRPRRLNWNWLSLGLGLAAATAILILARVNLNQPKKETRNIASILPVSVVPATTAEFVPADFTRVVYHTSDEGLRFPSGSAQPVRRLRSQTRETLEWRNPKSGASLRISYPSEEISLIPISGQ
jgi:hypothetical protein